jgi:hypothetical protein
MSWKEDLILTIAIVGGYYGFAAQMAWLWSGVVRFVGF